MDVLNIIGREQPLFNEDIKINQTRLTEVVTNARFLVIGGAGSIGKAVTLEIFKRNPIALHVVDISENNMVELVREIRSTIGYNDADFRTFAIDCGGVEFEALMQMGSGYDYVLNLSALKHVRSEKDPFTLMRMLEVNVLNTISTVKLAKQMGAKKYFCVSTDKAANPVNMMGASKRIMEMFLMRENGTLPISMARFANVAFSDGSLLHGFEQRFSKQQPITAPNDVRRYFLTPQESGELCLMSCIFGNNREIFFPKLNEQLNLIKFTQIAERFLAAKGYSMKQCSSEEEARGNALEIIASGHWPVYFFKSDTSGEKSFEEFYTASEMVDMDRFEAIGVIENDFQYQDAALDKFLENVEIMRRERRWSKQQLLDEFISLLPMFEHLETGKYLDGRM